MDAVYETTEELLDKKAKSKDDALMGDWNAVVGEGKEYNFVGHYGLRCRNNTEKIWQSFVSEDRCM